MSGQNLFLMRIATLMMISCCHNGIHILTMSYHKNDIALETTYNDCASEYDAHPIKLSNQLQRWLNYS